MRKRNPPAAATADIAAEACGVREAGKLAGMRHSLQADRRKNVGGPLGPQTKARSPK